MAFSSMPIPSWTTALHAAQHNAMHPRADSANVCIPTQLQSVVPSCSLACIKTFIANNYADLSCSATANLNLLCTTRTSSGLTIGEGSLQCVLSNCLGVDFQTQSGYTICEGIPKALPNTAETITATVDAITTLASGTASSHFTATTVMISTQATTSKSSSASSTTSRSSTKHSKTKTTTASTTEAVPSTPSGQDTATISSTDSSTLVPSSSSTSSNASMASAAASVVPQRSQLSYGAIAGIAAGSAVVLALIVGYLAYLCIVRNKKQKTKNQRFSTWFSPKTANGAAGASAQATSENSQRTSLFSLAKRYDATETQAEQRRSFWQRNSLPSNDIGVAVAASTRVSPEQPSGARSVGARLSWPSPSRRQVQPSQSQKGQSRWSVASSQFDDLEAQNQDVPILGSPRGRSSTRSFSSTEMVETPAPLRLSKVKPQDQTPPPTRIPLTPVYDNGNFETTVRQVFDDSPPKQAAAVYLQPQRPPVAMNFSRREPSLTRTSREQSLRGPSGTQIRQESTAERYSTKAPLIQRKQSQVTTRSMSVYTDIEVDETPEDEPDKQLGQPQESAPTQAAGRPPLRDLKWPQVPPSAVIAKQAQLPHSPRAAMTIRQVDPNSDSEKTGQETKPSTRDQLVARGRSFIRTDTSSSILTTSSASPVFPMPPLSRPVQALRRTSAQIQNALARQISDAYKAASRPTTATTTPTIATKETLPQQAYSRPGQMYQAIQRLSTGRSGAQKVVKQSYLPSPSNLQIPLPQEPLARNRTPQSGDLYFTVPVDNMYSQSSPGNTEHLPRFRDN